jgi:hypothetical protein
MTETLWSPDVPASPLPVHQDQHNDEDMMWRRGGRQRRGRGIFFFKLNNQKYFPLLSAATLYPSPIEKQYNRIMHP